ncbi:ParB N-terminal domain-containing protein [Halobacterium jilantaiense]|uniref:ParB-like nuclease domain-containing protein n=1 Tax=Halobacterium jilantaiense TaxID=355548 RepID=A0A1I0PWN5_9EURY|nr:hypothetical protein [Halobacterium jilantaiense]SEW18969.1 hypothetical protein SAMN04487945_2046 [Halobacterium jilantaiense]
MDLDRFEFYTAWHEFVNERRYDAPADPYRLVHVDPGDVQYYHSGLRLNWGLGRVRGGDWDRSEDLDRLRETTTYRGLHQRFVDGRDWEDTTLFERVRSQFETCETVRGYGSPAAFRDVRLSHVDDLYESIRDNGYRPNRDAGHDPPTEENAFETAYANRLEPLVAITRRGEVVWLEGFHRFSIADILGIDSIPVQILVRHAEWQAIRDQFADPRPDPDDYREHPDVQDLAA